MRILLFGKNGQLGWEFQRTLPVLGEVIKVDSDELDLARGEALRDFIRAQRPDVIVNAAAYTAVDRAESETELALAVNAAAPAIMAREALRLNAALVHFSTDYVFDGSLNRPYLETDLPHPLNVYGRSKLVGEQALAEVGGKWLLFRTSWVYSIRGDSFVTKLLKWAREKDELRVVTDQSSNPTWARFLAEAATLAIWIAVQRRDDEFPSGIYHLSNAGYASRFEWAQAVLSNGVSAKLLPALTSEFPAPATRPVFSALNCEKFVHTFGVRIPDWRESLSLALAELK